MGDHAGNTDRVERKLDQGETRIGDGLPPKRRDVPVHDTHDRRSDKAEREHMYEA